MWRKSIIGFFSLGICLFILVSQVFAGETDWTQFQKNAQKGAYSLVDTPVTTPRPAWSKYVYHDGTIGVQNTAVIKDDRVFVFAGTKLMALDKKSGETIWEKNIEGHGTLQIPTPAYGNGKLFIATFDGYVMAFDAADGNELWSKKLSSRNFQCPITYDEGRLYIGEGGTGGPANSYFCLDEEGNICWTYTGETAGYLWCGCSVVGDYVVFGDVDGFVTSLRKDTGEVADRVDLRDETRISFAREKPGRVRNSLSYTDGFVYVSSEDGIEAGYLWKIAFDPATGLFQNAGFSVATGFSTSSPVVYQERIYVGEGEHGAPGSLKCIDDGTGEILWSYPVEMGVKSSPALMVREEEIYIYFTTAMSDGFLYCLNGAGNLVWKYDLPDAGYIVQGAAVTEGQVFLGTSGGYLYCFAEETDWPSFQGDLYNRGIADGALPTEEPAVAWQAFTHYYATHGIDHPAVIANGKVFIFDVMECAWAFDIDTGAILWQTQLTEGERFNLATPAYGEGKVFFAASTGHIYALDENTGQVLWGGKITTGSYQKEELATQVKYEGGKVYVGGWEGSYFCLDAAGKDGAPEIIWKYSNSGKAFEWWSGPALVGDYLITGDGGGNLLCLNKKTGEEVEKISLAAVFGVNPGRVCSAVTYSPETGRLYFTSKNGYLFRCGFDSVSGDLKPEEGWCRKYSTTSASTPVVYQGRIYVCAGSFNAQGGLYCLAEKDGEEIWTYEFASIGGEASPVLTVQEGKAYLYFTTDCAEGSVYCVDETGQLCWEFTPDHPEYVLAGVGAADGKIFFVNDAGWLYALGAPVREDVNGDGKVNVLDMIQVGQRFGETGNPGWLKEDVNRDGKIDVQDIIMLEQQWTGKQ